MSNTNEIDRDTLKHLFERITLRQSRMDDARDEYEKALMDLYEKVKTFEYEGQWYQIICRQLVGRGEGKVPILKRIPGPPVSYARGAAKATNAPDLSDLDNVTAATESDTETVVEASEEELPEVVVDLPDFEETQADFA